MPDALTRDQRSALMSRVKTRDTAPEVALRRALWAAGVRGWRCHPKSCAGKARPRLDRPAGSRVRRRSLLAWASGSLLGAVRRRSGTPRSPGTGRGMSGSTPSSPSEAGEWSGSGISRSSGIFPAASRGFRKPWKCRHNFVDVGRLAVPCPPVFSVIDLFAGCGGLTRGFFDAGEFEPILAVELDRGRCRNVRAELRAAHRPARGRQPGEARGRSRVPEGRRDRRWTAVPGVLAAQHARCWAGPPRAVAGVLACAPPIGADSLRHGERARAAEVGGIPSVQSVPPRSSTTGLRGAYSTPRTTAFRRRASGPSSSARGNGSTALARADALPAGRHSARRRSLADLSRRGGRAATHADWRRTGITRGTRGR